MERTKKQKKLIIVHLSVFVLFMLVIGIFSYLYLLPNIKEIQGIKNSTYATFIDINMIEKK
ncbi:MAG: hypothetical protein LBQ59_04835 [Candidatus Peribacteria bacterium]|jgi:hypothetical protein|nr:hypothetical protein [Candidatus Peribacteria bacterium]